MIGDFDITDILGFIVVLLASGYVFANRRFIPGGLSNPFVLAFVAFMGVVCSAVIENTLLPALFNLLEHALRAAFAFLLAMGCWSLRGGGEQGEEP
jgi:hypothetical protein